MNKKNVVVGMGEIGKPIFQLISKVVPTIGYDINKKLITTNEIKKFKNFDTSLMHICIPFNNKFIQNTVALYKKFKPECIVIHSTISPLTTKQIQTSLRIPIIYSATRGVHKRMLQDLKRYTKFYGIESNAPSSKWAESTYTKLMKKCSVKTKKMSNPLTLELAKIVCDTSYYGWLINYAQISNMIATKNNVDYDEMWSFTDEIHKFLGNRPKMYPGIIGGHCIIPNLELIHNQTLKLIKSLNNDYVKKIKISKSKHSKTKKKLK